MRAGTMDRLVTLQSRSDPQNGYGEVTPTFATLATVRAARRELQGEERFRAQQLDARITCEYEIYYREDVTPRNRLVDDGVTYDILSVIQIGRRRGLRLLAMAAAD